MTTMEDWDFITMGFGKHKGKAFPQIPHDYLHWVAENISDPFLRTAAGRYLQRLSPPELEECVFLHLSASNVLIEIDAPYDLKDDIKDLTDRQWMSTRKRWCCPLYMLDEIMTAFPLAHISDELKKATQGETKRQTTLQELNATVGSGDVEFGEGLKLYKYQDTCTRFLDATDGCCLIGDEPGCISGDAMISLNRAGKSFKMRLDELYRKFNSDNAGYHDWDNAIPTMARSLMVDGTFRLNQVLKVIDKGRQPILQITTATGKVLKLTPDHEVKRPRGWTRADKLVLGNVILTNGTQVCKTQVCKRCGSDKNLITYKYAKFRGYCKECMYRQMRENGLAYKRQRVKQDGSLYISGGLKYHPNAPRRGMPEHRLIVEADMNGLTLDEWLAKLRIDDIAGCVFLSMDIEVHHINGDASDNRIENLQRVTLSEHRKIDGRHKNIADVFIPKGDVIIDIVSVAPQRVYDIVMDDPGRNFVANGIVVHNCGKTIESLAWLRMHQKYRPFLVVCPAVMKGTWALEIAKWIPDCKITTLSGKKPYIMSPGDGAVIINYELMDAWKTILCGHHYDTMIIDESHYLKDSRSLRSKAVEEVSEDVPHRILMSGTPTVNLPKDLWNQLHLVDPITYAKFFGWGLRYCGGHKEIIRDKEVWMFDGATNLEELSTLLKTSIMIRRTKSMVLPDLPDKTRIVNPIELENWDVYHNLEEICKKGAHGAWTDRAPITQFTEMLMAVMRGKITPSIRFINEQLNTVEKLVVFGVHREMLDAIVEKFDDKVGVVRIDGSTPTTKRTGLVEQFQTDPETRLFVGNMKAAGVGITLTAASHVTFVEYPWTPMQLIQAEDRLHRITQKNAVTVNVLAAEHTMDMHMADKIVNKQQIINTINNDMSWDDLRTIVRGE